MRVAIKNIHILDHPQIDANYIHKVLRDKSGSEYVEVDGVKIYLHSGIRYKMAKVDEPLKDEHSIEHKQFDTNLRITALQLAIKVHLEDPGSIGGILNGANQYYNFLSGNVK